MSMVNNKLLKAPEPKRLLEITLSIIGLNKNIINNQLVRNSRITILAKNLSYYFYLKEYNRTALETSKMFNVSRNDIYGAIKSVQKQLDTDEVIRIYYERIKSKLT